MYEIIPAEILQSTKNIPKLQNLYPNFQDWGQNKVPNQIF